MYCPSCKTKLKVDRTINLADPMTVRYYSCPKCGKSFDSSEKLRIRPVNQMNTTVGKAEAL